MLVEFRTIQVGKSSWVHDQLESYQKKISFFNPINLKLIKHDKDLLKSITDKDFVAIFVESGKSFSSREFATQVDRVVASGKQKSYFIVGGPFGLPDAVKQRADLSISLSPFVMNQEVALLVAVEQIFRAFTILNNHPYHND